MMSRNSSDKRRGSPSGPGSGGEKPHTEDSCDLWEKATQDVKKISNKGDTLPIAPRPSPRKKSAQSSSAAAPELPPRPAGGYEVDARTDRKLRQGRYPIDFTLDLHGLNQEEAHAALARTLTNLYNRNLRCVLVITGKGKEGGGVLRQQLPEWLKLEPLASIVLKNYPAQAGHGGAGASYVLLRRNRSL